MDREICCFQGAPGLDSLLDPRRAQVNICPSGKPVFSIPDAFSMA